MRCCPQAGARQAAKCLIASEIRRAQQFTHVAVDDQCPDGALAMDGSAWIRGRMPSGRLRACQVFS